MIADYVMALVRNPFAWDDPCAPVTRSTAVPTPLERLAHWRSTRRLVELTGARIRPWPVPACTLPGYLRRWDAQLP